MTLNIMAFSTKALNIIGLNATISTNGIKQSYICTVLLIATFFPAMLIVIVMNVIVLSVVAPFLGSAVARKYSNAQAFPKLSLI